MTTFIAIKEQALLLGVHVQTIRRWCKSGVLTEHHRTAGNHRRFELRSPDKEGETIGYTRVSTHGQKDDLEVQRQAIREKASAENIVLDSVISDIGSGINCKRKGFKVLISKILTGKVKHIVILHKDRLVRFGYEIIEQLCSVLNVKITVLEKSVLQTPEQVLCGSLIEILTVFCSKLYGMRSHSNKKIINAQLCSDISPTV